MEATCIDCLREQVLGYPPIVRDIFQHITSYEDLKSCELVCKTWKQEAAKLLSDHDILYRIFQKLPSRDLRSCRLVSNKWRLSANHVLKSVKSKTIVRIKDGEAVTRFINTFDTNPSPFIHFTFGKKEMPFDFDLDTSDTHLLTKMIGAHVKCLCLTYCTWTYDILRTLLFEKLPNLNDLLILNDMLPETENTTELNHLPSDRLIHPPIRPLLASDDWKPPEHPKLLNLKKLYIFIHLVEDERKPLPGAKEFVKDILLVAPNLEDLRSLYQSRRFIFEVILSEPQILLPRMTNLDVASSMAMEHLVVVYQPDMPAEHLSQLELRQFPLKYFSAVINRRDYPLEAMYSLLTSLGETLENLYIFVDTCGMKIFKEVPHSLCVKLKKLKSLALCCETVEKGFGFLQHLEQLEKLTLLKTDMSKFKFEEGLIYPQTSLFSNLQRLDLYKVTGQLDKSPFRNLFVYITIST